MRGLWASGAPNAYESVPKNWLIVPSCDGSPPRPSAALRRVHDVGPRHERAVELNRGQDVYLLALALDRTSGDLNLSARWAGVYGGGEGPSRQPHRQPRVG
jgi:hypothetical protein